MKNLNTSKLNNQKINIINVNFNHKKTFDKITSRSTPYIKECFKVAMKLSNKLSSKVLINGPVSKKHFLKNKFPGMSEYFASKVGKRDKEVMLIFNEAVSVSPSHNSYSFKECL